MKFARTLLAAAFGATLLTGFHAQAGEAEIRKNLAARIPQFAKIDEISKSPVSGLYEVRINGTEIIYTDEQGNYLLQGSLYDVKARKDLTARVGALFATEAARVAASLEPAKFGSSPEALRRESAALLDDVQRAAS